MSAAEHAPARSVKETCRLEPHKTATGDHNARHAAKYRDCSGRERKSHAPKAWTLLMIEYVNAPRNRSPHAYAPPFQNPPRPRRLRAAHDKRFSGREIEYPL